MACSIINHNEQSLDIDVPLLSQVELFQDSTRDGFPNEYMMTFLVSLIKIPGGLFAAIFLKRFPRRVVFISAGLLVAFGHMLMSLTQMEVAPTWCGIVAVTCAMFGYSAGYNSVASLLLGELLPAILRSVGVGLVATAEVLSSLSQTASESYLEETLGKGGLFIVFGTVVFLAVIYAVR